MDGTGATGRPGGALVKVSDGAVALDAISEEAGEPKAPGPTMHGITR